MSEDVLEAVLASTRSGPADELANLAGRAEGNLGRPTASCGRRTGTDRGHVRDASAWA